MAIADDEADWLLPDAQQPRPATFDEAFAVIVSTFPPDRLTEWARLPQEIARSRAHFGLGLWIRNRWVLGAPAPFLASLWEDPTSEHPDDVSSHIVRLCWLRLNGMPIEGLQPRRRMPIFRPPRLEWDDPGA